jgi:CheY-like chemotaxis protein
MDRVLIADDDVQLLTILTESLEKYKGKFEIVAAKNGLEAILALQKQTFSMVITEIRMPKVNGLVLLGYLSKNFPDLPCIIITDKSSGMLKDRLRKEVVNYIEKPFRIPELEKAILSVLDRKEKFGGKLNGVSVAGFMKLIERERLSCLCGLSSSKQGKGYFLFNNGSLYSAIHGNVKGEKAALRMLRMKDATITCGHLPRRRISRSIYCKIEDIEQKWQGPAGTEGPGNEMHDSANNEAPENVLRKSKKAK